MQPTGELEKVGLMEVFNVTVEEILLPFSDVLCTVNFVEIGGLETFFFSPCFCSLPFNNFCVRNWLLNRFVLQRRKELPPQLRLLDPTFTGADDYMKIERILQEHVFDDDDDDDNNSDFQAESSSSATLSDIENEDEDDNEDEDEDADK